MFRRGGRVRPLRGAAVDPALSLALEEPVLNTLGGARLAELARAGSTAAEFSVLGEDDAPEGLLWHGVNLSPLGAGTEALEEFGRHLAGRSRRSSSVVGPRQAVEAMWAPMAPTWAGQVREYRWSQPLLVADETPAALADVGLRRARPGEESAVFPAAVAMFREEVGADPTRGDGGRSYGNRVTELIRAGRTYVVMHDGLVLFKADVGAIFGPVAQVHGVWVRPGHRSRGLGRAAMAQLVSQVRADLAPQVSLYVNDFNEPARRAYAAAGFHEAGELSTILF
ncbi:GNAT family N-acetyltransferase [Brachybacterium sp. SGAir0954]|uniref:GNAT family N-acetyltransferase n=1 Tax=Brachybacterium sp. SGAir0954 TaxID=2571029 RepID=UPI0010CD38AF|nr:DUF4081 domain-containing GNAT family N-acetyltransferase [Brachybacterium sp. SGAir0954]QCR54523.1 GNAT family N-acetyltransferase [Brachybacterium sp. SGAir0954]